MSDDTLQQKINTARAAMAGERTRDPQRLFATELAKRRSTSLTLSPAEKEIPASQTLSSEELAKRRAEARRAMESFEQKKRREARERAEVEARELARKIEEMKKARLELEKKRAVETAEERAAREKAERETEENYQKRLSEAKEKIAAISAAEAADIDTYRTLRTDVSKEVTDKGLTMSKIVLEEEARRRLATLPREKEKSKLPLLIGLGSILLVLVSVGTLYASLLLTSPAVTQVQPLTITSIVFSDREEELIINNKSTEDLVSDFTRFVKENNPSFKVINVYLTQTVETEKEISKKLVTTEGMLEALDLNLPTSFTHFLLPTYMTGVVSLSTSSSGAPFYIFKTRSFENTFDSLLREENLIIGTLLGRLTGDATQTTIQKGTFKDKIVNNIDTRLVESEAGTTTLAIYGFLDRETFALTTSEEAFLSLITAYQTPRPNIK